MDRDFSGEVRVDNLFIHIEIGIIRVVNMLKLKDAGSFGREKFSWLLIQECGKGAQNTLFSLRIWDKMSITTFMHSLIVQSQFI
jgi:hypothetical protein